MSLFGGNVMDAPSYIDDVVTLSTMPPPKKYNRDGILIQYVGESSCEWKRGYFYMMSGNEWRPIEVNMNVDIHQCQNYDNNKNTKCKICGAPLVLSKARNGICKCEWCRSENYV